VKNVAAKLRAFWADPDRKPFWKIALELARTGWHEGELPVHYLTRCLYRRNIENYLDYIGNRRVNRLQAAVSPRHEIPLLEDKLYFQLVFERAGLRLPRMLGHNFGGTFHGHAPASILDPAEFRRILGNVLDDASDGVVFIKPRHGISGLGVHRITPEILGDADQLERLHGAVILGSYVFQEALKQHPAVSRIYPISINTIRMDTFVHDDGHSEPLSAFMRFGSDGRFVDNASQGGCYVGIDFQTGCLHALGHRPLEFGGEVCETHPSTGFKFSGFEIPYFSEAKSLATQAALVTAGNRLVGWDIAISPDGPVLVEGNHNYTKDLMEITYGGYRRHPTFAMILKKFAP
jgi:hypothetical protein